MNTSKTNQKHFNTAPTKTKKITTWVILSLIILGLLGGYQIYSSQTTMLKRREAMAKQRQVLIDYYKTQGLSDTEINEKLVEQLSQQRADFDPPWYFSIMRTFHQATGTGPRFNGGQPLSENFHKSGSAQVAGQSSTNNPQK